MSPQRRVRLTFALLLGLTVAAVGLLGRAVAWPASPIVGLTVAVSSVVAAVSGGLALRILMTVDRR